MGGVCVSGGEGSGNQRAQCSHSSPTLHPFVAHAMLPRGQPLGDDALVRAPILVRRILQLQLKDVW